MDNSITDWDTINQLQQDIRKFGVFNWSHFALPSGKPVKGTYKRTKLTLMVNDYVVAGKISKKDKTIVEFITHEFGMPLPELKVGQNISDLKIPDVQAINKAFREALTNVWPELQKIKMTRLQAMEKAIEKELEPLNKELEKIREDLNG